MSDMNPPPEQGSGQPPPQQPQQPPQQWGQQPPPSGQWSQQAPPPYQGGAYGAPGVPMSQFGRPLSEWWKRLVAIIIDSLILAIPTWIISFVLLAGAFSTASIDPATGQLTGGNAGLFSGAFIGTNLVAAILPIIYYSLMNGSAKGQTVGKMVMKIQVRDAATGGPIGVGRGFGRELVAILGGVVTCGIFTIVDGLWPLWDQNRQALHDKVVNSVVVDTD